MWSLLIGNLRYRKELAVYAFGVALLLATIVTVAAWVLVGRGALDENFKVLYVFPTSILFASFVPAIAALLGDARERRVAGHAALPQSKSQIGLARVLTPAVFVLIGLVAAVTIALVIGGDARWSLVWDFVGMAGWTLLCIQVAIFLAETSSLLEHSPGARGMIQAGVALLLIFYCAVEVAHLLDATSPIVSMLQTIPKIDRETFKGPLVLHGLAWSVAGLAFFAFMRRKSLTA
jgi:hypothetical protein